MNESILTAIKKLLGIDESYEHFDDQIIAHINLVFNILQQMGVGPNEGFRISDASTTWGNYLSDDILIYTVQDYIYFKVKLLFDPPQSSSAVQSINEILDELEFRIRVELDGRTKTTETGKEDVIE